MLETITGLLGSSLVGSLLGAAFRLAPEFLKFFDKVNERSHELKMFALQTELEKVKGDYRVEERYVDAGIEQTKAILESFKSDGEALKRAPAWVAGASALVRPAVTYTVFGLYVLFKLTMIYVGISTVGWQPTLTVWNPEDQAMLTMILTYWFIGRDIPKFMPR